MADLNYWFGRLAATTEDGRSANVLTLDGAGADSLAGTVANCATSKQTPAAPSYGPTWTAAILTAIGGDLWVTVAADPTAVAAAAQTIRLPEGAQISVAVRAGQKIAGLNA